MRSQVHTWGQRLVGIATTLFLLGPFLAYCSLLPPRVGFYLFGLGGLLGIVSLVLNGIVMLTQRQGTAGLVISLVLSAAFILPAIPTRNYPMINDIVTDPDAPLAFQEATTLPANSGRDMRYPGESFAAQQREAYPDLAPYISTEAAPATYQRVIDVARKQSGWTIMRSDAAAMELEAVATSFLFRFQDDIVLAVRPHPQGSSVHMRSKSRDGRSDLGANAARIRSFFAALADESHSQ